MAFLRSSLLTSQFEDTVSTIYMCFKCSFLTISDVFMPCEYSCYAACQPIYAIFCAPLYHLLAYHLPHKIYKILRHIIATQKEPTLKTAKLCLLLVITGIVVLFVLEDRKQFYIQVYDGTYPWVRRPLVSIVRNQSTRAVYTVYTPDCGLLFHGDHWESALTQRMLYGERGKMPVHHYRCLNCDARRDRTDHHSCNTCTCSSGDGQAGENSSVNQNYTTDSHQLNNYISSLNRTNMEMSYSDRHGSAIKRRNRPTRNTDDSRAASDIIHLAYIIYLHVGAPLEQFFILLDILYNANDIFCVAMHNDVSLQQNISIQQKVKCLGNILLSRHTFHSPWTKLQAEFGCLKILLKSNVTWTHVINLDSTSFPIKPVQKIRHQIASIAYENIQIFHRIDTGLNKKEQIPLYYGSHFHILTWKFTYQYLMKRVPLTQHILNAIRNEDIGNIAMEVYWATLIKYHYSKTENANYTIGKHLVFQTKWSLRNIREHLYCMYNKIDFKIKLNSTITTHLLVTNHTSSFSVEQCVYTTPELHRLRHSSHVFATGFNIVVDHIAFQCIKERTS